MVASVLKNISCRSIFVKIIFLIVLDKYTKLKINNKYNYTNCTPIFYRVLNMLFLATLS